MTRSRRFLVGVVFSYTYQALVIIAGLWLTPFLLRHIGQREFGLWLVATQALLYLGLIDFGVAALLPRDIAYALGRSGERSPELATTLGRALRIALWQTVVLALGLGVWWLVLPASLQPYRDAIGIVCLAFLIAFPLRLATGTLQGLQDTMFTGRAQIVSWFLITSLTVILAYGGFGLRALALSWAAGQVTGAAVAVGRLVYRYPHVLPRRLPTLPWPDLRDQMQRCGWTSVAQLAQQMTFSSDLLLLGRMLGPAAVVPYSCTGKLIAVLANQPQIMMQVATPGLCELRAGEEKERLRQVTSALTLALLLLSGLICCVAVIMNQWFVGWWVGPTQYGGLTLSLLLLLTMLVRHWTTTSAYVVFCLGREKRISLTNLLDGAVTIAATIATVPWLGLAGGPCGSLAGACLVSLPLNLALMVRDGGWTWPSLLSPLLPWMWRFALVFSGSVAVAYFLPLHSLVPVALWCAVAVSAYGALMLPMTFQSPLAPYLQPLGTKLRRWVEPVPGLARLLPSTEKTG